MSELQKALQSGLGAHNKHDFRAHKTELRTYSYDWMQVPHHLSDSLKKAFL